MVTARSAYELEQAHLLASAGFNLASLVNNHVWDHEALGMVTTRNNLRHAGIHSAGCGLSLAEAQQATYADRNGVCLALVCAARSHTPQSVAGPGDEAAFLRPRPGVNVVRARHVTVLNDSDFSVIRNIAVAQGQDLARLDTDVTLHAGQHPVFSSLWRRGQTMGPPRIVWDINQSDLDGVKASIREAITKSNGVIFSFHAHESESGTADATNHHRRRIPCPAVWLRNGKGGGDVSTLKGLLPGLALCLHPESWTLEHERANPRHYYFKCQL